jgi:hypothetical protein
LSALSGSAHVAREGEQEGGRKRAVLAKLPEPQQVARSRRYALPGRARAQPATSAEDIEPRLKDVWPRESKFERRCYELLREAYVKARYSRHYRITAEQLEWLSGRVEVLQRTVRELCEERISTLAEAA